MELEKLFKETISDGLSKSSVFASSIAARFVTDETFVKELASSISKDKLSEAIAKEIIRTAHFDRRNNSAAANYYRMIMREAVEKASQKIADEMTHEVARA